MTKSDRQASYGLRSLADTISTIAQPLLGRRGFAGNRVIAEWPAIVGQHLAARSLPERIVYPPRQRAGGTLHVRVGSGASAIEFQHHEPLIVERINTYIGYGAVARLRLVHRPLPAPPPTRPSPRPLDPAETASIEATVAGIEDPRLKQILVDLGKQVWIRSKSPRC
jgi:hypothetical protein